MLILKKPIVLECCLKFFNKNFYFFFHFHHEAINTAIFNFAQFYHEAINEMLVLNHFW